MEDFLRGQFINALPLEKNTVGIYFLFDGDELVYVGKTTRGHSRVFEHTDKKFDRYSFQPYLESVLNETEEKLILEYKPKYNKTINCNNIKKIDQDYCTLMQALGKHSKRVFYFLGKYTNEHEYIKIMKDENIKYKYLDRGNHKKKLCVLKGDVCKLREKLEKKLKR